MKKNTIIKIATLGCTLVGMGVIMNSCSCGYNAKKHKVVMGTSETKVAVENSLDFANNLFAQSVKEHKNDNLVLSPYSAGVALSMLKEGAAGETKNEFDRVLGKDFTIIDPIQQKLDDFSKDFLERENKRRKEAGKSVLDLEGYTAMLSSANSIWVDSNKGSVISPSYVKLLNDKFAAQYFAEKFASKKTVEKINTWCEKNTNGMIPSIVDELNPSLVMLLINALYFKAPWENEFSESATKDRIFYGLNSDNKVPTMFQEESFQYAEVNGTQYIALPYKIEGRNIAMLIALPKEGEDINTFVEGLANFKTEDVINSFEETNVELYLPKFKANSTLMLINTLQAMGLKNALSSVADYSNMSERNLMVDEILQKCVVDVNEKGSEAAAVTAIGVRMTSMPIRPSKTVKMEVNRPFAFAIADMDASEVLFFGRIVDLK